MNNPSLRHNTITVGELKSLLAQHDDEKLVFFAYNYGDRVRTTIAGNIHRVEEDQVVYSDYHQDCKIADLDYDEGKPDLTDAVIIR